MPETANLVQSRREMATGWMKGWQCKSKAVDDVVHNHHHSRHSDNKNHHQHHNLLHHSSSCRNSVQSLKDIVETTRRTKPNKPKPSKPPQARPFKRPVSRKSEPGFHPQPPIRTRSSSAESFFPSLTELSEGHPSRNVVEIIFRTSWGEKTFPGRVKMVFKIQNLTRMVTRFEEYRESVKSRVSYTAMDDCGEYHARCVADGNEVMKFYCLGPTSSGGGAYDTDSGAWAFHTVKGAAVFTFSGSGVAHENAGGGRGHRAMLVCRIIAGRVCKQLGFDSFLEGKVGYDSVCGQNGELLVFDSRALLPCFLIIYTM